MRELLIGSAIVTLCVAIAGWGDRYGFNAAKVARIEKELADVNGRLAEFTRRDEQSAIDSEALRSQGYQDALADLGDGNKCIVTPAMAKAFGRIVQ